MNSRLGYMGDVGIFDEKKRLVRPHFITSGDSDSVGGSAS